HVEAGAQAAREARADLLVGLGGGSAMDCAKGVNFLVSNGGRVEDYWGFGKAKRPMLPSIGIPTTAGTGSEAQSYALISQAGSHRKMACGDRKARFQGVLLDPAVLATVPREVMAVSGFDALAHALESFVCTRANPISRLLSKEAWALLASAFLQVLTEPEDPRARARMLLGAFLAGAAIEKSMLGLAHSCANPLTARYGVVHGAAVGLMLPAVVRFNGPEVEGLYGELLGASGVANDGSGSAAQLSDLLAGLRESAGLPARLQQVGVEAARLPTLAGEAAEQWTAQFNPRAAGVDELLRLYESAY
ncbi:MAG: iron-containing alcohol dehydrogenase, partial [Acidobacteria bacterium]|nr:iron-containing alcohol dehydrogenase [Acidobacteriota bacterium]